MNISCIKTSGSIIQWLKIWCQPVCSLIPVLISLLLVSHESLSKSPNSLYSNLETKDINNSFIAYSIIIRNARNYACKSIQYSANQRRCSINIKCSEMSQVILLICCVGQVKLCLSGEKKENTSNKYFESIFYLFQKKKVQEIVVTKVSQ